MTAVASYRAVISFKYGITPISHDDAEEMSNYSLIILALVTHEVLE